MPKKTQPASKRASSKTQDLGLVTYQGKPIMSGEEWIDFHCQQFEKTNNPLDLMEAFIASVQASVYPPQSILEALAKAFQTVLDSKGKKTLDVELGLRRIGTGAWTMFGKKKKKGTVFWLASTLFALMTGYGLKINEAAERVSLFLESNPRLKFYEADGLSQSYSRSWQKRFRFDQYEPASYVHPANWTPEFRKAFIQRFPSPRIS